jgi:ribose transport system substrate-binding protein
MRKALLGIAAALSIFAVLACTPSGGGDAKKEIVIAVVPQSLANPVFLPAKAAAERTGKELGVKVEWIASVRAEASEQVGVIEGLIERKVDGIAISCNTPEALEGVLKRAIAEGIKVSTYDADSNKSGRAFYTGTANYQAGVIAAEQMIELYKDSGLARVRVAQLEGIPGAFDIEARKQGFADTIKGTNLEVVYSGPCDDDVDKSIEIIEAYTRANGDNFEAWYMSGGWPYIVNPDATPEVNAWKAKSPEHKVVTLDVFPTSIEFFDRGLIDVAIAQNFDGMGEQSVRGLYALITEGDEGLKKLYGDKFEITEDGIFIDSGVQLIYPHNYKELISAE